MRIVEGSWIDQYLDYVKEQESPQIFHFWTAVSVIASALGRNVYVDMGYFKLFPNLYVVLIAESATCRKSTAMRLGTDILEAIDDAPNILSQKITPEAMIAELCSAGIVKTEEGEPRNSECVINSEELSVFLGEDAFKNGTAALLTRFFDCPSLWAYQTKSKGKEPLHDVVVNLLGASTPDWLRRSIPSDATGGGFMGRFMFVLSRDPGSINAIPRVTEEMMQMKSNLIADLSEIRRMRGEFALTKEAFKKFEEWYEDWMINLKDESGYSPKKHTYVLKLAMVLSAAESGKLVIERSHINGALQALQRIEPGMNEVVASIWMSPAGQVARKVLAIIRAQGEAGITKGRLLRRCWRFADADMMNKILDTLCQSGLVELRSKKLGNRQIRNTYYAHKHTLLV